ncbi:MAG: hypothetical protein GYB49_07020 [Alphaproteobacteria bacterium]|nr:hypothetical protein [Hyphomonas sp.]MBR9806954.1 hypothetical protein [Alphaproteobacteria bacterium]|tara:strand:- start:860 stop:1465 length:606 start_codon:yes stop_codon:yes gene_type:complete
MLRPLTVGLCALGLTACVSVLPEQKVPDGLYRFGPMEAEYDLQASVIVREPDASRLVAGRAIAAVDETGTVRLVPGVEWTDSSTHLMQMAMLDLLKGPGGDTAISPNSGGLADYELFWTVMDFSLAGTTGHCRIRASLLDGSSRAVLEQTVVSTSAEATGKGNPARAQALSEAGRKCVRDVAAFVSEKAVPKDEETPELEL